jgi:peptidoglycan/xylan/chitin deacetylase (PgdA/CDA1 family)
MKGLHIFYYHLVSDVYKDYYPHSNIISTKLFEKQIKYFVNKFELITINEAYERFNSGYKFDKQAVITTDDGFVENYSVVCNILEKYNVKGSFFLIENSIDNNNFMWRHALFVLKSKMLNFDLQKAISSLLHDFDIPGPTIKEDLLNWSSRTFSYKLKDQLTNELWTKLMPISINDYLISNKPYLNYVQIKEMLGSGHVIGGHTRSHPISSFLSQEDIKYEIYDSTKSLANKFNTNILAFSFPFERSNRVTEILINYFNGIEVLLGTKMRTHANLCSPYYWERINMETRSYKSRLLLEPWNNQLRRRQPSNFF